MFIIIGVVVKIVAIVATMFIVGVIIVALNIISGLIWIWWHIMHIHNQRQCTTEGIYIYIHTCMCMQIHLKL